MTQTIRRLAHTHGIRGRSSGTVYNGMAWLAAVFRPARGALA